MPKVTEQHREAQRQRIQEAALCVIERKGIAATTMGDIIKESGLSAGAIYGYWSGKDDLLADIASTVVASKGGEFAALARRQPVPPPHEAVRTLIELLPHEWIESGVLLQFWGVVGVDSTMSDQVRRHAQTLFDGACAYLEAWMRQEGIDPAEALPLANPFCALVQGYVLQASLGVATSLDAYATAAQALVDGRLATH